MHAAGSANFSRKIRYLGLRNRVAGCSFRRFSRALGIVCVTLIGFLAGCELLPSNQSIPAAPPVAQAVEPVAAVTKTKPQEAAAIALEAKSAAQPEPE